MKRGLEIFSLHGKTVLLTGATGHLGVEMAEALAAAGALVLVNSRSQERSLALTQWLIGSGWAAEPAVFDVKDPLAVAQFLALRQGEPINVLVNNAYLGGAGSVESATTADYVNSFEISIVATHNLMQLLLPSLRLAVQRYGDASVINLASMYAMVSPDQRIYASSEAANPPFYGAAKAALLQWTRYAACEFGREGIRVNAISPGPFPSEAVQASAPEFIQKLANKVPMARVGRAKELAGPTLFLASAASSFVNGANIVVDGGWTCW